MLRILLFQTLFVHAPFIRFIIIKPNFNKEISYFYIFIIYILNYDNFTTEMKSFLV